MTKKLMLLLISLILIIILSMGCSKQNVSTIITETQNKIPEPYTLMLKQLNSNDLDMAQKYADLTIKDYKDTPYIYNANLVKSIINLSKMCTIRVKSNYIIAGSDKIGSLNSKEDIDKLQGYIEDLQKESKLYEDIYYETTQYLLDHFLDKDNIQLTFPDVPSDITFPDYSALNFFSTVGYPVPTDSEMTTGDKQSVLAWTFLVIKDHSNSSQFYPDYFYCLSVYADNNIMKEKLLNKIIELTENDKYNKTRINAQDELSKLEVN